MQFFLLTIMASIVYSSLLRSRRAQAAFDAAALQRAATARRVTAARLATQQAQVDPALLFSTLELVETLYERDPDAAERALAELIEFLRTALPKMDEEGSTLGREAHLARAFLGIVHARMGSRLDARIEIPPEIESASFPAMVLVPLVEHAVRHGLEPLPHGGRLEVRAAKKADRLEVVVVHNGADDPDRTWLDPLHERVTGLYGDEARVSINTAALGPCATVDLPYETAPAEPAAIPAMATTMTTGERAMKNPLQQAPSMKTGRAPRRFLHRSAAVFAVAVAVALVSPILPAGAQQETEPIVKLEKVEVTGSHIARTEIESALPVQVITREDIERSGATTVAEMMAKVSANIVGNERSDERRSAPACRGCRASTCAASATARRWCC